MAGQDMPPKGGYEPVQYKVRSLRAEDGESRGGRGERGLTRAAQSSSQGFPTWHGVAGYGCCHGVWVV